MRQHHLVMTSFLLQPIAFGSWLPRIPDIQHALNLGPAQLAMALFGMPLGILIALPFASRSLKRLGSRVTVGFGFIAMFLAITVAMWSVSQLMLFTMLALVGAMNTVLLLALNMEASFIEKKQNSLILNTCHGFGSVGLMVGSLAGSVLAAYGVPFYWSVGLVCIGLLPFVIVTTWMLCDQDFTAQEVVNEKDRGKLIPDWPLLGICLFAFGIAMTEGAMADWSAIYLRDKFNASSGSAGIGFTFFAAMVALGRFTGDQMKARWGAVVCARTCTAIALFGMVMTLAASSIVVAYFGFALLGYGVSVGYPLAVSAVASMSDQQASSNIATLTFIALLGFLVGPPVIGIIAQHSSMQIGLAVLVPVLFVSLLLVNRLGTKVEVV